MTDDEKPDVTEPEKDTKDTKGTAETVDAAPAEADETTETVAADEAETADEADAEGTTDTEDTEDTTEVVPTPVKEPKSVKAAKAAEAAGAPSADRRSPLRSILVPAALALILAVSAGLTTWAYYAMYRPDRATNAEVAAGVIKAASDGTVALLSYSPETLEGDFTNAKTHLTGDFLNYYTDFTQQIVTPAAKDKQVKTSAAVVRSAVAQLQPNSAEVLLFINQSTTSKENPDGSFTASSVKVGLTKVGDAWLIAAFDPV